MFLRCFKLRNMFRLFVSLNLDGRPCFFELFGRDGLFILVLSPQHHF